MKLYLTRHGETIQNVQRISQGHIDGSLTERGREQAGALVIRLNDVSIDRIYSSDLGRCRDTLAPLLKARPSIPILYDENLRERSTGIYENKPMAGVDWSTIDWNANAIGEAGVEPNPLLYRRVITAINQMIMDHPNDTVLVMTHGGPIRCIHAAVDHLPMSVAMNERPDNTSITTYDLNAPLPIEPILGEPHPTTSI